LIARTYMGQRREFAYLNLEGADFIIIRNEKQVEVQLKLDYFQVDNNINEKQIFPVILYPKELVRKKQKVKQDKIQRDSKKEEEKKGETPDETKEFFNSYLCLRNKFKNVIFIEKIDFLFQTMVLKMDDELLGFVMKFATTLTEELHTNLTGVHEVFR